MFVVIQFEDVDKQHWLDDISICDEKQKHGYITRANGSECIWCTEDRPEREYAIPDKSRGKLHLSELSP